MTLPTKWAVEITSIQNAERLQKLMPKHRHDIGRIVHFAAQDVPTLCLSKNHESGLFGYARQKYYKENGYTILSIEQLENLLNEG